MPRPQAGQSPHVGSASCSALHRSRHRHCPAANPQLASAIDFRLNVRLNKACGADVQALCGGERRRCRVLTLRAGRTCPGCRLLQPTTALPLLSPLQTWRGCARRRSVMARFLDCLRERLDEVTSDDCRAEVLHFVKEEVGGPWGAL